MILLTDTSKYITSEIYPVILGLGTAGITFRIAKKGMDAVNAGISFEEFIQQAWRVLLAGIIMYTIDGVVIIIKGYYT